MFGSTGAAKEGFDTRTTVPFAIRPQVQHAY